MLKEAGIAVDTTVVPGQQNNGMQQQQTQDQAQPDQADAQDTNAQQQDAAPPARVLQMKRG